MRETLGHRDPRDTFPLGNIDTVELKATKFYKVLLQVDTVLFFSDLGLYGLNLYLKPLERFNGMIFGAGPSSNK